MQYELGEMVEYEDYLLTSFSKFDMDNRANLNLKQFMEFLINFWNNLDVIYANREVNITLFGSSSLTRFTNMLNITDEELVNAIIWTFKISKIKFRHPNKIRLVLDENTYKNINLYKIKEINKYGV